jgi:heme exporter protein A
MLTVDRLTGQSNDKTLFCDCGFTLLPGALVRVDGDNGCGKTHFFSMVAGQKKVPQGCVLFANQETRGDDEFFAELLFLPEGFPAYSSRMTVEKQLRRWLHKEQKELLEAAIHYFDLRDVLKTPLADLSTGWLMRVKLSLLILNPSLIWLLDRPFYALDATTKRKVETLIAGRCQQQGIVFFTHDNDTALNPHHTVDLSDWAA